MTNPQPQHNDSTSGSQPRFGQAENANGPRKSAGNWSARLASVPQDPSLQKPRPIPTHSRPDKPDKFQNQKTGFLLVSTGFAFACTLCLFLLTFVILWLGQTSRHVYTQGADALVIRAVLRTDIDAITSEELAARIRREAPGINMEIIDEAMGRSLLALQEPWISQMPDFEVTPLPTLLEMRHPDLLTHPEQVSKFVESLKKEPGVDFVAFNESAHNHLLKLAETSGKIQHHAMSWLLVTLALLAFLALTACRAISPLLSIGTDISYTLISGLAAWAAAWLLFRYWEGGVADTGEWQNLNAGAYIKVGICALVIILAATISGRLLNRNAK